MGAAGELIEPNGKPIIRMFVRLAVKGTKTRLLVIASTKHIKKIGKLIDRNCNDGHKRPLAKAESLHAKHKTTVSSFDIFSLGKESTNSRTCLGHLEHEFHIFIPYT